MITDKLFNISAISGNRIFIRTDEREISFGQMAAAVNRFAEKCLLDGINEGDRVVVMCGNRPAYLVAWFALTEIGAIIVPVNTMSKGDNLRHAITKSAAVAILAEMDLLAKIREAVEAIELSPKISSLPEECFTEEMAHRRPRCRRSASEDTNAILFTSGTTGVPKGTMISHNSYDLAGEQMVEALQLTPDDRIMVFLPLFHANPQMYAVASSLEVGASIILSTKFSAADFLPLARRFQATGFTYVGTVLTILDKTIAYQDTDHCIRFGVGGGAPEKVWRALEERLGVTINELYGMTETGGWVSMNTAVSRQIGSVGRARPGVSLRIVDEDDRDVPAGAKGEIVAKAMDPSMFFSGYWDEPKITAETLRDDWLHTGDGGWIDDEGFLHFDGRLKELIRRGGEMISPVEIELQLIKHSDVQDCAVVAVPDDVLDEEIKAMVVPAGPTDAVTLRTFLQERLPSHMVPRYFSFIDSIPKTETQKIQRHELTKSTAAVIDLGGQNRPNVQAVEPRWTRRPNGANWGEFGPDDQLGRLNLLTPEKVREAVAEVRDGQVFCLSLPLDLPGGNVLNPARHPPLLHPTSRDERPVYLHSFLEEHNTTDVVCDDAVILTLQYSTQWDSLAHVGSMFDARGTGVPEKVFYNGFTALDFTPPNPAYGGGTRANRLGIEHMAECGVQGRGVLIDLRHHFGEERRRIGYDEVLGICDADGIEVERGDIVCFHTGFAELLVQMAGVPDVQRLAKACAVLDGSDTKLLKWIDDCGMAALVADNYAVEERPYDFHGDGCHALLPLHEHCLFKLGIHLGELWHLTPLARWLRENGRSRFLLTAPPLRLPGAVGSPLNPIATV